ncbi:MAG TPA: SGNH/GDSL hydrolase family protein [Planctomycetota bacterium]|nr:SGNH/GDSL hydrolase family protein [Planctomycetota bacterium]HRR81850.1 SGNH/GDSL hydrolase family protein [Planctomycetota bacterium]HRT93592.1 SGNH/GDSL hydrolase family protein [Planctomycetota bacterium]
MKGWETGLVATLALCCGLGLAEEAKKADRWEKSMQAFEERDAKNPPPKGEIVFIGSSSIVGWNLAKYFPDLKAVNRGFGGSQIADSVQYADRILLPLEPRIVVFYAGDNDIASGKSPEKVFEDYQAFVKKVHDKLPETTIIYIPIKPSIARWKLWEKMKAANALIAEHVKTDKRLAYLDIVPGMLGEDGKPKPELFVKDGLHLSPAGYELWTGLLRPLLNAR